MDLQVPTQEWLREHSQHYEAFMEEDAMARADKIAVSIVGAITLVLVVIILATWGGY